MYWQRCVAVGNMCLGGRTEAHRNSQRGLDSSVSEVDGNKSPCFHGFTAGLSGRCAKDSAFTRITGIASTNSPDELQHAGTNLSGLLWDDESSCCGGRVIHRLQTAMRGGVRCGGWGGGDDDHVLTWLLAVASVLLTSPRQVMQLRDPGASRGDSAPPSTLITQTAALCGRRRGAGWEHALSLLPVSWSAGKREEDRSFQCSWRILVECIVSLLFTFSDCRSVFWARTMADETTAKR